MVLLKRSATSSRGMSPRPRAQHAGQRSAAPKAKIRNRAIGRIASLSFGALYGLSFMFAVFSQSLRVFVCKPMHYLLAERPGGSSEDSKYFVLCHSSRPRRFCHAGFVKPCNRMAVWPRQCRYIEPTGLERQLEICRADYDSQVTACVDFLLPADDDRRVLASRFAAWLIHICQDDSSNFQA
jgi:hypothetical protein